MKRKVMVLEYLQWFIMWFCLLRYQIFFVGASDPRGACALSLCYWHPVNAQDSLALPGSKPETILIASGDTILLRQFNLPQQTWRGKGEAERCQSTEDQQRNGLVWKIVGVFVFLVYCVLYIVRVWVRNSVTEHRFIYALLHIIEELKTFGAISNHILWDTKKFVIWESISIL